MQYSIKSSIKKIMALALCAMMLVPTVTARADEKTYGYIVYGEDLSEAQRAKVLELFKEDVVCDEYKVATCSNKEEHKAFDAYLSSSVIGSKAVSSILLNPGKEGDGITVKMDNINYCTKEMYQNALITSGVEDVVVHVAAPFEVSGTCALLSAMNGYELMTGKKLNPDAVDTAVDELVTTGEVGDAIGDNDGAAEFIATLKQKVADSKKDLTEDQLEKLIDKTAEEMNLELDIELKKQLISLLKKLQGIDLDVNALKKQAGDLYKKVSGVLSQIEVSEEEKAAAMSFMGKLLDAFLKLIGMRE